MSELDAVDFAKWFQRTVEKCDKETLNRLIDWDLLAGRACDGLPLSEAEREETVFALAMGMSGRSGSDAGFIPELLRAVSEGASYSFVSTDEEDGVRRALFRVILGDGGVDYHRCILAKDPDGSIVVSDICSYASGQSLTEGGRWVAMTLGGNRSDAVLDRLTGADREKASFAETMQAIGKARARGDHAEVLRLHRKLPKTMQRSKACLVNRILAAQEVDEKEWLAAIEEFKACYPGSGALALLMIDYYFVRKEYDKALDCIEALEAEVGDSYLNLLKANLEYMKKNLDAARKHIDQFVDDFPDLMDGYDVRATIAIEQGDFPAVTEAVKILHRDFDIDPVALTNLPSYAPYKKSKEYDKLSEYLKEQAKQPKSTTLIPRPSLHSSPKSQVPAPHQSNHLLTRRNP